MRTLADTPACAALQPDGRRVHDPGPPCVYCIGSPLSLDTTRAAAEKVDVHLLFLIRAKCLRQIRATVTRGCHGTIPIP